MFALSLWRRSIVTRVIAGLLCAVLCECWLAQLSAEDTQAPGKRLYVSKQGDNSDGTSWQRAFHTIQAALSAVPDNRGHHEIVVRPDRYIEANLAPQFAGAAGAYNTLVGDFDGSLGSGAQGWVVIDMAKDWKTVFPQ